MWFRRRAGYIRRCCIDPKRGRADPLRGASTRRKTETSASACSADGHSLVAQPDPSRQPTEARVASKDHIAVALDFGPARAKGPHFKGPHTYRIVGRLRYTGAP